MRGVVRALIVGVLAVTIGVPGAAFAADRPDAMGGATTASAFNTSLSDTIATGTDKDWYRFRTGSSGYARILLNYLPKNYQVKLFDGAGTQLAVSARKGVAFEEIYRLLPAGTYFVQVTSQDGTSSATPYRLSFRPLTEGQKILSSSRMDLHDPDFNQDLTFISGEVLNNTSHHYDYYEITARFYNTTGQLVAIDGTYVDQEPLAPRTRGTFMVVTEVPETAVRYTLTVSGERSTVGPLTGMVNKPGVPWVSGDVRHFPGEVTNRTGRDVYAEAVVALYDVAGNVRFAGWSDVQPESLVKGATGFYDVWTPVMSGIVFTRYYFSAWDDSDEEFRRAPRERRGLTAAG